jgi:hypothetical protein
MHRRFAGHWEKTLETSPNARRHLGSELYDDHLRIGVPLVLVYFFEALLQFSFRYPFRFVAGRNVPFPNQRELLAAL